MSSTRQQRRSMEREAMKSRTPQDIAKEQDRQYRRFQALRASLVCLLLELGVDPERIAQRLVVARDGGFRDVPAWRRPIEELNELIRVVRAAPGQYADAVDVAEAARRPS